MIGAIFPVGGSFKGSISYLETGKDGLQHGRAAWMEFHNLPTRNAQLAACFMAATARNSVSGTRTPVYHFSVSFDVDDPVDEAMMRRVAERTLRDMGLREYEAVVAAHQDRSHLHLHFVVNRVHPERFTLWSNWWDYARLEKSLRAQEMELGLRIVPGWHAPVPAAALARDGLAGPQPEEARVRPQPGPKRGGAGFLREVTERAAPVLEQARSWAELERGLAERGLSLRVKGGGFTVTDGSRQVKASEVGRAFSRFHLEKRLGQYPDYRARMAVAEQVATSPEVGRVNQAAPVEDPEPVRRSEPEAQRPVLGDPQRIRPEQPDGPVESPQLELQFTAGAAELPQAADGSLAAQADHTGSQAVASAEWDQAAGSPQLSLPLTTDAAQLRPPSPPDTRVAPAHGPAQTELPLVTKPTVRPPPQPPQNRERAPSGGSQPAKPTEPPVPRPAELARTPAPQPRPDRPLTERERYRQARCSFGRAMAGLYADPGAARRAFALDVFETGSVLAVASLKIAPERYGRLRPLARVDDAVAAAPLGVDYATQLSRRPRPAYLSATMKLRIAATIQEADREIKRASDAADAAKREKEYLIKLGPKIRDAETEVLEWAANVYREPESAIESLKAHKDRSTLVEVLKVLRERPEQFGALIPDKGVLERGRELIGRAQCRTARGCVPLLAPYVEWRMRLGEPPSEEMIEQATDKAKAAERAVFAAKEARDAILAGEASSLIREAAQDLRRVPGKVSPARLQQQLSAMLPDSVASLVPQAIQLAVELAEGPKRGRGGGREV